VSADPGEARERLDARVRGMVQGVGFRYFVLREARGLGLDGWVANETDGSVHVVADGPRHALDALLDLLREGPPASLVDRVSTNWISLPPGGGTVGSGFSIRSGGHRGD
jgi:acylphosphatase